MIRSVFATLVIVLGTAFSAYSQANLRPAAWESKPIDAWDETDVADILQRSPWGQRISNRTAEPSFLGVIVQDLYATFTLRSALTVRLALIRLRQISEKYDSMTEKQRKEFDAKYRSLRECTQCDDYYIVAVGGDSRILKNAVIVKRRKEMIFLSNELGERRELEKFVPQVQTGSEAVFLFPRKDEKGKPLLNADSKTLTFTFRNESNDDAVVKLVERVEIKVKDISRDGIVIF